MFSCRSLLPLRCERRKREGASTVSLNHPLAAILTEARRKNAHTAISIHDVVGLVPGNPGLRPSLRAGLGALVTDLWPSQPVWVWDSPPGFAALARAGQPLRPRKRWLAILERAPASCSCSPLAWLLWSRSPCLRWSSFSSESNTDPRQHAERSGSGSRELPISFCFHPLADPSGLRPWLLA